MSTELLIFLCAVGIAAAISFGFFCAMLFTCESEKGRAAERECTEDANLLSWVARQSVVDLVNRTDDRRRVNGRLVKILTNETGGRFTCGVDAVGWTEANIRVTVIPITDWRFKASVVCGKEQRTFYYIRTFELGLSGLDEKIEVSE